MSRFRHFATYPALAPLVAFAVALIAVGGVGAHSPSSFYPAKWSSQYTPADWYFHSSVPGGNVRSRIIDGSNQWNEGIMSFRAQFASRGGALPSAGDCRRAAQVQQDHSIVAWGRIDGARNRYQAITFTCTSRQAGLPSSEPRRIRFFYVYFDAEEPWYTGTGPTPGPAGNPGARIDLWYVATHEFGHATGWVGHLGSNDPEYRGPECPMDRNRSTMCAGTPPGAEWGRDLARHDKHTFQAAY